MRTKAWLLVLLLCVLSVASGKPKGTLPHGSADSYPAHAQKPGVLWEPCCSAVSRCARPLEWIWAIAA